VSEDEARRIETLVRKRNELRAARQYAEADLVRQELDAMGVALEDTPQGTSWKKVTR
jgi:cysteinyl-tRNA synthetase